jgi:hypothetical protein
MIRTRDGFGLGSIVLAITFALFVAACGSDGKSTVTKDSGPDVAAGGKQNACPVEGCNITIVDVQPAGDELEITWNTNYAPKFARNHVHVFWDTYSADEVSNDASEKGHTQGEWVPTGAYPRFVTKGAVSTAKRADSTTLCVTAGDRDHNVIDSSIVDCRDVSALLG